MEIETALSKALARNVAKEMDLDKMAKQIAPQMASILKKRMIDAVSKCDLRDIIWGAIPQKELEEAFKKKIISSITKNHTP